jgi:hypothetical protein
MPPITAGSCAVLLAGSVCRLVSRSRDPPYGADRPPVQPRTSTRTKRSPRGDLYTLPTTGLLVRLLSV